MIRTIYKLSSKVVKANNGSVSLDYLDALSTGQIIGIGESQVVSWIDELNDTTSEQLDEKYRKLRSERKFREANDLCFMSELVQIEYSNNEHFVREFTLNDIEYTWFANKGSVVVTYVCKDFSDVLRDRLDNGRDMSKEFIPAKLNAYLGLAMSSSKAVKTQPKHVVIVHDNVTEFEDTYRSVTVDGVNVVTEMVRMESSDGNGCIDYKLMQIWSDELDYQGKMSSGVSIRNSFMKGMVFPVDLQQFFSDNNVTHITDVYGDVHDVRDIDMILPVSMFKLWNSYTNYSEYERNCQENGYSFRVCKESHEVKASRTNYQQTTDLTLTDEQIARMIAPSVQYLKDVAGGDWLSTVLYLNGQSLTENSTTIKGLEQALMIDERLIHDTYIVNMVKTLTFKRRQQMCLGKYNIKTNFQIVSSDLYHFLGDVCGVPNDGLLKRGEVYSQWHVEREYKEAIAVRSPMISKENLARVNIVDSPQLREFYKYMSEIVVLNDFDLIAETLAGLDKDGDSVQLMVDEVMLEAQVPTLPVKCQGVDGSKLKTKCDTLEPLIQASILACDESKYNIGSCINKITSMFSKRSEFEVGSKEYEEMNSRLLLGLMISQGYIDFKKNGTVVMDMPEHWYKLDACKNDWERKLCADKKPYFLATYKPKKNKSKFKTNFKDYKQTMEIIHTRAVAHWGITGEELLSMSKDELTDEQAEFVEYYTNMCEVYLRDNSTQHRLCIATEDAIGKLSYTDNIVNCKHLFKDERVKNNPKVTKEVRNLYEKYTKDIANIHATDVDENGFSCIVKLRQQLYVDLVELHEDITVVYNSFVDVVYNTKSTLLFEIFGDMVIENLARKNNYEMRIPVADDNGGYEYQSKRFRIEVKKLKG